MNKKKRIRGLGDWGIRSTLPIVSSGLSKTNLRVVSESVLLTNAGARFTMLQIRCGSPLPASSSDQNILPPYLCFSAGTNCVLPSSLRETMRRPTGMSIVNARRRFDCSCYNSFTLSEHRHRALYFVYITRIVSE